MADHDAHDLVIGIEKRLANEAQALRDFASEIDPGLEKADTWSANTRTRERYRRIAAHYEAVGIRRTLIRLGIWDLATEGDE